MDYPDEMGGTDLAVGALGVRIVLDLELVASRELRERIRDLWTDATPPSDDAAVRSASLRLSDTVPDPGSTGSTIRQDRTRVDIVSDDFRILASALSSQVTLKAIEARKGELVMLHACGIAEPDGRVTAFVGPSGRGKTTLASRLARRFGYVTDETVGVDAEGRVHPYRKPLSVIESGSHHGDKTQLNSQALGLVPLPAEPLVLGAICLIERDPEHEAAPDVTEVGLAEAITALVPELSYLPALERPLQTLAALIDRVGGVRRIRYQDAEQVVDVVPGLRSRPRSPQLWEALPAESAPRVRSDDVYHRAPADDGISISGVYVFLHGTRVQVVDGVGPLIWDALPADRATITDDVVARIGVPETGDARTLIDRALDDLIDAGIVEAGVHRDDAVAVEESS